MLRKATGPQINADELLVFNRRSPAFIGGWIISRFFPHPADTRFQKLAYFTACLRARSSATTSDPRPS
jgi:hypothetical protein